jgi:hypothetical protein
MADIDRVFDFNLSLYPYTYTEWIVSKRFILFPLLQSAMKRDTSATIA